MGAEVRAGAAPKAAEVVAAGVVEVVAEAAVEVLEAEEAEEARLSERRDSVPRERNKKGLVERLDEAFVFRGECRGLGREVFGRCDS